MCPRRNGLQCSESVLCRFNRNRKKEKKQDLRSDLGGSKAKDINCTDLFIQGEEIAASKWCCSSNHFKYLDVDGKEEE